MTVSNEAPMVETATRINHSTTLFAAIGTRFGTSALSNNNNTPEISEKTYYAQPNEDIYIHVHISNPDGIEILSFTLNGVKYSSYMFEKGSDLETLILKCNVGAQEGIQQYTIDAIKYVDGENIKDVRMDGDRTIEVLVGNDAQNLMFETKTEGWDIVIEPKWNNTFTGEKTILSLALYDGNTLLYELNPNVRTISNLPMNKRLLLIATYLDNGETIKVTTVLQTRGQSEGLLVVNGVVAELGSCTDTELYINMPVGEVAFKDNAHIIKITLGSGVTSIGKGAFSGCTSLTSISLPDNITSLNNELFAGCTNLTNIVIPNSVTRIGDNTFSRCTSLTTITIPDSTTDIGSGAFMGCGLTSIVIPESVTMIGANVFTDCNQLKTMTIPYIWPTISGSIYTSFSSYLFGGSLAFITTVTLTGGDGIIYDYSFSYSQFSTIILPENITSIGNNAFEYCSELKNINLPDGLQHIGMYAFNNCSSLTNVSIPNSVTTIGDAAFIDCGLTSITFPTNVENLGNGLFQGCSNLTTITIPDGVTHIGEGVFFDCSNLTTIIIPNSVIHIGSGAFYECSSLTSITLPNQLTAINDNTFYNCKNLTDITIPNNVTRIGDYAFSGCSSLTNITIPDGVTSIGEQAFYDCTSLITITIPASVTSIGTHRFTKKYALTTINYAGSMNEWTYIARKITFSNKITVHCSDGEIVLPN